MTAPLATGSYKEPAPTAATTRGGVYIPAGTVPVSGQLWAGAPALGEVHMHNSHSGAHNVCRCTAACSMQSTKCCLPSLSCMRCPPPNTQVSTDTGTTTSVAPMRGGMPIATDVGTTTMVTQV